MVAEAGVGAGVRGAAGAAAEAAAVATTAAGGAAGMEAVRWTLDKYNCLQDLC